MALLADVVRQAAESQEVLRREERDAVLEGKTLSAEDLFRDRREVRAAEGREKLRHGMAGLLTGWNGSCDTGATSSTNGVMYR